MKIVNWNKKTKNMKISIVLIFMKIFLMFMMNKLFSIKKKNKKQLIKI